jgi:hypothetical protein
MGTKVPNYGQAQSIPGGFHENDTVNGDSNGAPPGYPKITSPTSAQTRVGSDLEDTLGSSAGPYGTAIHLPSTVIYGEPYPNPWVSVSNAPLSPPIFSQPCNAAATCAKSSALPNPVSISVSASGNPAPTLSQVSASGCTDTLPTNGLSFSSTGNSGSITGTPTTAPATLHINLRASNNQGTTNQCLTLSITTPNNIPTTQITSPADNSNYTAPANITITAQASDSDGTVAAINFFQGGSTPIGTYTAPAPANQISGSIVWTQVPAGSYSITTKTTDNSGGTSNASSIVHVTVGSGPTPPPAAKIQLHP